MTCAPRWEYSLEAVVAGRPAGAARARRALVDLGAEVCERPLADGVSRRWLLRAPDEARLGAAELALRAHLGVALQRCEDRVMQAHADGVLRTRAMRPIDTRDDYALVGDPGAIRVARLIRDNPSRASELTNRGSTIGVVSDGGDAAGLGAIGATAELPLVEGKAAAYTTLARLNAVPLVVNARGLSMLINTIVGISAGFAGIHLTDLGAPGCFHVTQQLTARVGIPVLNEQIDAMPIVVVAALRNALKVVCKPIKNARIVVGGLTPASVGTARLLRHIGVHDVIVVDQGHIVTRDDLNGGSYTRALVARHTNPRELQGTLRDALDQADVYLRYAPDRLDDTTLSSMAPDPIGFSLTQSASDSDAHIVAANATISAGTDTNEPNLVASVIAYPGLMRGMMEHGVDHINCATAAAATDALACGVHSGPDTDRLLPTLTDRHVPELLAATVGRHARAYASCGAPQTSRTNERPNR